jgi:putative salt-induced outer membrane protein
VQVLRQPAGLIRAAYAQETRMSDRWTIAALLLALSAAPLFAQDKPAEPKKLGWKDAAELGYVITSGNSDSSTLGLKNTLNYDWEKARFEMKLGAVKAKSTAVPFFATGTATDFTRQDNDPETTAESYYLNGRYDKNITDRFFWFGGAGWDRNTFAGVQNRYTAFGGVGNTWLDTDKTKWRTDYAVTYTKEDDVIEPADFDGSFAGLRLSSNFLHKWSESGSYGNDTIVDDNLEDTSDLRVNMTNWVAVNMSTHLALKVSLQWLYDHQPALVNADLFTADPDDGGVPVDANLDGVQDQVAVEADTLDSIFTTALVIKY